MLVSPENRATLIRTLEANIPSIQDGPYRDALSLMLTVLYDQQMLESFAREQIRDINRLTEELTKQCVQFGQLFGSMESTSDGKGSADVMMQ